ncbi:S-layer homology domain-containing protein [Paenibacillus radicis (ex Xue et al. 2023)]|uniref:S-layer homology domain-containing protein n=1 Tax=Paenibacillus radicis (ex Xue et al. 2023) TaxID=2972489 RepID=A0ABT1YF05_9BACL|nr:S-layer homology domain-containing protein [Paenibacillus radicis (ex Xue et al. 2023)]MCR8631786.1 S-layer homology domain-containing protein [Paenibacillus radicis (ex Xue et al. 2023)]
MMKQLTAFLLVASLLLQLVVPPGQSFAAAPYTEPKDSLIAANGRSITEKVGELVSAVTGSVYGGASMPDKAPEIEASVTKVVYLQSGPLPPVLFSLTPYVTTESAEVAGTAALNGIVRLFASYEGTTSVEIGDTVASEVYGPNIGRFKLNIPFPQEGNYELTASVEVNGEVSAASGPQRFIVDRTPPADPWSIEWSNVTYNSIELKWDHPMINDPNHPGSYIEDPTVDHYIIEKDGQEVKTTTERNYFEGNLGEMEKLLYTIRTVDKAGNKSPGTDQWVATFHKNAVLIAKIPDHAEYAHMFWKPTISKDGSTVAYIGSLNPQFREYELFVYDMKSGETERIAAMQEYMAETEQLFDISPDGRYIAYSEFFEKENGATAYNIVIYDRVTKSKERLPKSFSGSATSISMSDDTQWITFSSTADDIVSEDTNEYGDVFLYNRFSADKKIVRISVSADGVQGNDSSTGSVITDNGRYAMFLSYANNLTPEATKSMVKLFIYDTSTGKLEYAPFINNGQESMVWDVSPSADGRYIVFTSAWQTEDKRLYFMDRQTGNSEIVISFPRNEDIGIRNPRLSSDNRYISMNYYNYNPESRPGPYEAFDSQWGSVRYDLTNKEFKRVGNRAGSTYDTSMSGNGSIVAFTSGHSDVYAVCLEVEELCKTKPQQEDEILRPGWSATPSVHGLPVMGGSFTVRAYSQAGKQLEALVDYKVENGSSIETKQLTLPMNETVGTPEQYTANVQIPAGTVELSAIQIRLKQQPSVSVQLDSLPQKVAGRLKVTVNSEFLDALQGASVLLWSKGKNVGNSSKLTKPSGQSGYLEAVVDLAEGSDYRLTIVDPAGQSLLLQEGVAVVSGREIRKEVTVNPQAEVKVKLLSGQLEVSNQYVEFYNSQDQLLFTGLTEYHGHVSLRGNYYAGDIIKIRPAVRPPYAVPQTASVRLQPGLNEQTIQIEKLTKGSLAGIVTDAKGAPLGGVKVLLQGNNAQFEVETDESGTYAIEADVGSYASSAHTTKGIPLKTLEISYFYVGAGEQLRYSPVLYNIDAGMLTIDAKMKPVDGDWQTINISDWREAVHYGFTIEGSGKNTFHSVGHIEGNRVKVKGWGGSVANVCLSGNEAGLSRSCDEVVLDEQVSGTAELRLVEKGRIRGAIAGATPTSNYRGELYQKLDGGYMSFRRYINLDQNGNFWTSVPQSGDYRITLAGANSNLEPWQTYSFDVTVKEGELKDLGPVAIPRSDDLFQGKKGNGLSTEELKAMPGDTVTLRGSYSLTGINSVDDAVLAIGIPAGTQLLADSVMLNGIQVTPTVNGGTADARVGSIVNGKEGSFSYRLKIDNAAAFDVHAMVRINYKRAGKAAVEQLGASFIRIGDVSLEAPERSVGNSIKVTGRAPAGQKVTVHTDEQLVGYAEATPGGIWYANITLPTKAVDKVWGESSRYRLTAQIESPQGIKQSQPVIVSVDSNYAAITKFTMRQSDGRVLSFDPGQGVARFPYVIVPGMTMYFSIDFNQPQNVSNVKVTVGMIEAKAAWNESTQAFEALFVPPYSLGTGIFVTYDEKPKEYQTGPVPSQSDWETSRSNLPDVWRNATYEVIEDEEVPQWKGAAGTDDGFYHSKPMKVTLDNEGKDTLFVRWKMKPVTKPDRGNTGRIPYYDYSMDWNEAAGMITINATVPVSLLSPQQQIEFAQQFGSKGSQDYVINSLQFIVSNGKAAKALPIGPLNGLRTYVMDGLSLAKYADELIKFQDYVINSECHVPTVNNYIKATDLLFEQASRNLVVKNTMMGLGLIAGTLTLAIPPVGAFVLGSTFKLIGDIGMNSWKENLDQLKADFEKDKKWRDDMAAAGAIDRCKKKDDDDNKKKRKEDDKVAEPTWIWDPSGYVYETLSENRVEGVTATLLQQDNDSKQWQVWDSAWFGQQNPLVTDRQGRYGWDVPEGKWKVLYEKEGYLPAESAELTVLPPHLDVNIPMVSLQAPQVTVIDAVYGDGVQVSFTKYMLDDTLTDASIRVQTADGDIIAGTVVPVEPKTDGMQQTVAKRFRFIPDPNDDKFKQGNSYKVVIAAQSLSYAQVAMKEDYIADAVVVKAANTAPTEAASGLRAAGGSRQIALEWQAVDGTDFKAYKLYWQPQAGGAAGSKVIAANQTFAVLDGLERSKAYELKLVTVGRNDVESAGVRVTAETAQEEAVVADTTAPGAVTEARVTAELTALNLAWADPADNDLRKVLVSWKKEDDTGFSIPEYVDKGVQSIRISGLLPGTVYKIHLTAADTYWNESDVVELTARTMDTIAPGNVTAPSGVGLAKSIALSWNDPSDVDLKYILVSWRKQGTTESFSSPVTIAKGVNSYIITGLGAATEYEVKLVAVDESGNQASGVTVTARTLSENSSSSGRGGGGGSVVPVETTNPVTTENTIMVDVTADPQQWKGFDGRIGLDIPAGAFANGHKLTVQQVGENEIAKPETNNQYSSVFRLMLDSGSLAGPLKLTLKYDANKHRDFDERKLGLYRQDEADPTKWSYAGGIFDSRSSSISATIGRLGTYAVMDYNKPFTDLVGHWSKRDTDVLISRHIVDGMTADEFQPDRPVTRAQFTKLLVEMTMSQEKVNPSVGSSIEQESFADVPIGAWHYPYITAAKKQGLVQGGEDGMFRPEDPLTREELAVLVVRALGLEAQVKELEASGSLPGFSDGRAIASWAAAYVETARSHKLIDGVAEGVFGPQATASRAQGSVLILRAMSKLGLIGQ